MMTKRYKPTDKYFIADPSFYPLLGTTGLFCSVFGLVQVLHGGALGPYILAAGIAILLATMFLWFGAVVKESLAGLHSHQMDLTYRWGMLWFIVSEIFLFGIFFFALFYVRIFIIPDLGATVGPIVESLRMGGSSYTHTLLWPNFVSQWPLLANPNPELFVAPKEVIYTWGIPALNTVLLLTSAVTVTWAHWGLKKDNRKHLIIGLILTILLGMTFEGFQIHEYMEAYNELGLTLGSGIYGSTFFTLTGLHAWHVTVGIIMLTVILIRALKGHFHSEHHFAFEAVSWYWHMVDVVWLFLFVFVYWL
ncbi:MAG TPA: cytochrome c oxidase subunit 3 [Gammaproteobacteria bacterium]|jgi:cytochrome c oxidase subunit 3|nr:cytochrome c oxidase subunit 3 [Gammaproteobacteria bacterium]